MRFYYTLQGETDRKISRLDSDNDKMLVLCRAGTKYSTVSDFTSTIGNSKIHWLMRAVALDLDLPPEKIFPPFKESKRANKEVHEPEPLTDAIRKFYANRPNRGGKKTPMPVSRKGHGTA